MSRPSRSHRCHLLAAMLAALLVVGSGFAAVAPPVAQNATEEDETGPKVGQVSGPIRAQAGPPVPPRWAQSPTRPAPPGEPSVPPRHLRPSAPARGPDGPYLRC